MNYQLPGYTLKETLFNNALTRIQRAVRNEDQCRVVIKAFATDFPNSRQRQSFLLSYDLLEKFEHPNIVKAIDLLEQDGLPVIVLEDTHSIDLRQYAQQFTKQQLPIETVLNIAIQVCDALSVIHKAEVIHKDLHPGNILINVSTEQVHINDFGLASLLSREQASLAPPEQLEGVLAYISPEQTGRMNRSVDYRSDFYTLGVTLYELLLGQQPFRADDALGLVYAHIAKRHTPLLACRSDTPPVLSHIIDKLLNKVAENRYQSATGIQKDLEKCRLLLNSQRDTIEFPLGKEDVSSHFQIPQKLYGRAREVTTILDCFERSRSGKPHLLTVSGYSGVGKSALVHEVHQSIAEHNGLFISGKFDQFQRSTPYSALKQALKTWLLYALSLGEVKLKAIRTGIHDVLGSNARVMIDFMPEFMPLLGELPRLSWLEAKESLERFNNVFQKFMTFISQDCPIVMFIDDLQWADRGTLNLLPKIFEGGGDQLLVIAAYRINEVDQNHPAMQVFSWVAEHTPDSFSSLVVGPLKLSDTIALLSESLHRPKTEIQSLAELIQRKTEGNPFFVNEFLKTLYYEGLLSFDLTACCWVWDVKAIQKKGITDNVVELMLDKMQRLPKETQALMQIAASVGSRFDLEMLATIQSATVEQVTEKLWPAITEGLILQEGGAWYLGVDASLYDVTTSGAINTPSTSIQSSGMLEHALVPHCKFLHDRMLEAAYHSLSGDKRQQIHLHIGRLLRAEMLNNLPLSHELTSSIKLFSVVEQLNRAMGLITGAQERVELAWLNLYAAERSFQAGVWDVAAKYAEKGMALLSDAAWESDYALSYELFFVRLESEYLSTNIVQANELSECILQHAKTNYEKANVCRLQLIHNLSKRVFWAMERGLQGLRYCGLRIPSLSHIDEELAENESRTLAVLCKKNNLSQVLQTIKEPDSELLKLECLLLVRLSGYSQVAGLPALLKYSQCRAMNVLLSYGAGKQTITILGLYSILLAKQGLFEEADFFSKTAIKLVEKYPDSTDLAVFYNGIGAMQWFYTSPFSEAVEHQKTSHELGFETGEVVGGIFAGFSNSIINYFVMGAPLEKLSLRLDQLEEMMHKYQMHISAGHYYAYLLSGLRCQKIENSALASPCDKSNFSSSEWTLIQSCILKPFIEHLNVQWFFWSDQLDQAWESVKLAEPSLELMSGFITPLEHRFLAALLACQKYPLAAEKEQTELSYYISCSMNELETLAQLCPENFEHKLRLLKAEKSWAMAAEMSDTLSLYDQAIKSAQAGAYLQYLAFAYERCAAYWVVQGFNTAAKSYGQKAIYTYQQWGCEHKCSVLKKKYAKLLAGDSTLLTNDQAFLEAGSLVPSRANQVDIDTQSSTRTKPLGIQDPLSGQHFGSVMHAVQQISSELDLQKLLLRSLQLILEITHAEKVAFVIDQHNVKIVEGMVTNSQDMISGTNLQDCPDIPASVVNYVFKKGSTFNLESEELDEQGKYILHNEPYVKSCECKAMLCIPIITGEKVSSVLYLDSCHSQHRFTEYHLRIIDMVISQSRISFQNARLFRKSEHLNKTLEQKVVLRTKALEATNYDLKATNEELAAFSYSVSHDLRAPLRSIKGFSEILLEDYLEKFDQSGVSLLNRIIESANKMTELINGLLELSRVQNAEIDLKPIELTKMARVIAKSLNDEKIRCNRLAKPVLFQCADFIVIPGDERMFQSVMENLLNNAWKYSSKVEQAVVEFGVKCLDGVTVYFIKDNGAGFDMKHANHLFTTFKRLHLEHEFPGTGVGLDTVQRIINKHSGRIWAEAEIGKGATFYFTLWTEGL